MLKTKGGTFLRSDTNTGKQIHNLLQTSSENQLSNGLDLLNIDIPSISINNPEEDTNNISKEGGNTDNYTKVNEDELNRMMKNYEQCITELRAYKGRVVALQEDLEEVEKENNTLRMITEKSEQGRRMSILITENEALFQSNRTLCDQLEDLEIELEDKENEESVTIDIEKTKLRRQSEAFLQQNEQLEEELRSLKDEDEEKLRDHSDLRHQKETLDNKINQMKDLVSESDEKVAFLEKEKQDLKKLLDKLRIETTNQELQMKNITNQNHDLTLKNSMLEVALS